MESGVLLSFFWKYLITQFLVWGGIGAVDGRSYILVVY
jgi:hypothetical protein